MRRGDPNLLQLALLALLLLLFIVSFFDGIVRTMEAKDKGLRRWTAVEALDLKQTEPKTLKTLKRKDQR